MTWYEWMECCKNMDTLSKTEQDYGKSWQNTWSVGWVKGGRNGGRGGNEKILVLSF
jgi:hypothetical protein